MCDKHVIAGLSPNRTNTSCAIISGTVVCHVFVSVIFSIQYVQMFRYSR